MDESGRLNPWYQETAAIVLLLWFCFPIGLVLMWREPSWHRNAKIGITAFFAISAVAGAIAGFTSSS